MGSNEPFGTSWADQWDYNPDPVPETKIKDTRKYSKKIGEGLDKTKSAASTGVKKVKQGRTPSGISRLFECELLTEAANKKGMTLAQVCLRWILEQEGGEDTGGEF
ncbi:hypothetical protein RJ641_012631 [Dillenia turbinata]|uniref:NADP-dependent oxidoreductase domain-containing protein n=1 Tax=Dillenia turbinata TaxID=194707 RepID=A0AAN8Z0R2_9MAGN